MYSDDFTFDDIDKSFDELDKLIEFAQAGERGPFGGRSFKYCASLEMINLMMEEVTPTDIKIYQLEGTWMAEVKYRGIEFISIAGKHKPEEWETPDPTQETA